MVQLEKLFRLEFYWIENLLKTFVTEVLPSEIRRLNQSFRQLIAASVQVAPRISLTKPQLNYSGAPISFERDVRFDIVTV